MNLLEYIQNIKIHAEYEPTEYVQPNENSKYIPIEYERIEND